MSVMISSWLASLEAEKRDLAKNKPWKCRSVDQRLQFFIELSKGRDVRFRALSGVRSVTANRLSMDQSL
jgi:hypothetical protein